MHNQSPLPGATILSEPMFGVEFQAMSRPSAPSPRLMPPPARGRRLSCPTGPGPPSDCQSVSGPDFSTSPHDASASWSVAPGMSPSYDSYAFGSSSAMAHDEASGTTASSLGSAASFGRLRYAHLRDYGNDDNSSEPGSEHGNRRISQETEDRYDPQSDDEPGENGEERGSAGGRAAHGPLNCPYRKRNKARFNIRDHFKCTNAFKEFSHLKSHIKTCHKREGGPINQEDPAHDVEDGITEDIDNLLIARKNRHKVSNWERLWQTLFPGDTDIPLPVFEPCIKAAADEFPAMAKKAMEAVKNAQVYRVSDMLKQSLQGSWPDAEAFLPIAYNIVTAINSELEASFDKLVRELEHAVPQRTPVLSGSLRPRSTGTKSRRGNGGSRDIARRGCSAGAPSLPNEQPAPRQRLLHPVPNAVGDNSSPLIAYSLHAATHQEQGGLNTVTSFQSSTDSGYNQGWTSQPNETEFMASTAPQYIPNLAISHWQMDGLTGHPFSGSVQGNQPPVTDIFSNYPQTPATYGSHLNRRSRQSGFSTQYTTPVHNLEALGHDII